MAPTTSSRSRLLSAAATGPATMASASVPSPWYNTPQAAAYIGHAPGTLERMRITGGGPVYSRVSRKCMYHRDDLDHWMNLGRRRSTSGPLIPTPRERDGRPRHRET
jgi:hypothetical protein